MPTSKRNTLAAALATCLLMSSMAIAQSQSSPAAPPVEPVDVVEAVDGADGIDGIESADVEATVDAADTVDAATVPDDAGSTAAARNAGPAPNPALADPTLLPVFRQFGELPGITALMDDFMVLLLADARMRPFFENVDQAKVKQHLVEQVCVILGGPCRYTGRDMRESHAELQINRNNFNALVEVLQVAMDKRGIPFRAQNRLLAKLAPMHREIQTR